MCQLYPKLFWVAKKEKSQRESLTSRTHAPPTFRKTFVSDQCPSADQQKLIFRETKSYICKQFSSLEDQNRFKLSIRRQTLDKINRTLGDFSELVSSIWSVIPKNVPRIKYASSADPSPGYFLVPSVE